MKAGNCTKPTKLSTLIRKTTVSNHNKSHFDKNPSIVPDLSTMNLIIAPIIFALLALSPAVAQQQQQQQRPRQNQNQSPVIDTPSFSGEDNTRNNIDSNNLHIEDA